MNLRRASFENEKEINIFRDPVDHSIKALAVEYILVVEIATKLVRETIS